MARLKKAETKKPAPKGRPTTYTKKAAETVCNRITNGESVRAICDDPKMPARQTLVSWLAKNQEFSYHYAQALEARTHFLAESRHELLDDAIAEMARIGDDVSHNIQFNILKERIRAIEWDAERLAAKKYKVKDSEQNQGEAQPLNISFNVEAPVKDVRTTNAKP